MSKKEITELVREYRTLSAQIAGLEAEREAIKDLLKEHMDVQGASELRGFDWEIHYTPVEQRRIDTKRLSATYPEIARECTKTIKFRRFEVR